MKSLIIGILIIICSGMQISAQSFFMDLYPKSNISNSIETDLEEIRDSSDIVRIRQVQNPDIQVFLPSKRIVRSEAVVICPGGGYWILAYDLEGEDIAKYFNSRGIVAIVLKYRLPDSESQPEPHKAPLMDAQRAMRLVRYNAEKWGIDPEKIGIMGFSAGGHLASTLSTHFDSGNPDSEDPIERISCRPDFSVLVYPVISFTADYAHRGSAENLLGEEPDPGLLKTFSNETQVTADTPPAILIHASDDSGVPVANSISYYEALIKNDISAEMHIYSYGKHGFGLASGKGDLSEWPDQVSRWIKRLYQ
jgi:acetyl esterase/lipase